MLNQVLVRLDDAETTELLLAEIQRDGRIWCGPTQWAGGTAMRISVSSWKTTTSDARAAADVIIDCAQRVRDAGSTAHEPTRARFAIRALTRPVRGATIEHMFLQGSLFGLAEPSIDDRRVDRTWLDDTTWIDHSPTWLAGADAVFEELLHALPWEQRRGVKMYDRLVDEPRLVHWWSVSDRHAGTARRARHDPPRVRANGTASRSTRSASTCTATATTRWRGTATATATASRIRSSRSSASVRHARYGSALGRWAVACLDLGYGDLFVMGGACQHRWEHCVPKVHDVGPRISVTFRHDAR